MDLATVLVADDHMEACQMMTGLVQACGHRCVGVTSGEAALEYLDGNCLPQIFRSIA